MPDLNDENVACGKLAGRGDLGDSNPHHEESDVSKEGGAEEIGEFQTPMWSGKVRRTPVLVFDASMRDVDDLMTYNEALRGGEKNEGKLALK